MTNVERSIEKSRRWHAWAGSISELQRIGAVAEELVGVRRDALLAEFDARDHGTLSANYLAEKRREIVESLTLKVTVQDGDDRVSGPLDAVFGEIDRRTATSVAFGVRHYNYGATERLEVSLTRKGRVMQGVRVEVASADQGWGRHAFVRMSEEIEKGVPKWAWVHSLYGPAVVIAIFDLLLILSLAVGVIPIYRHVSPQVGALIMIGIGVAWPISMLAFGSRVRNLMFPPVEITS